MTKSFSKSACRMTALLAASLTISAIASHAAQAHESRKPVAAKGSLGRELSEYKRNTTVHLIVSQSKTVVLRDRIDRTFIADPGIAEPVCVAENQLVFLGKAPGTTTMLIWDDDGNVASIDVRVSRPSGFLSKIASSFRRQLDNKRSAGSMYVVRDADASEINEACRAVAKSQIWQEKHRERNRDYTKSPWYSDYKRENERLKGKVVAEAERGSIPSGTVFVPISQSSAFKSSDKLTRIVASSRDSAEPVAFSDNDFAVLGKSPGRTIVEIHDSSGAVVTLAVEVSSPGSWLGTGLKKLREFLKSGFLTLNKKYSIPAATNQPIKFEEIAVSHCVNLRATDPGMIELRHRVVRTSIADPGIAEPIVVTPTNIVLVGKHPGITTLTIWDENGNADSLELRVRGNDREWQKGVKAAYDEFANQADEDASDTAGPAPSNPVETKNTHHTITIWSGRQMDILSVPRS